MDKLERSAVEVVARAIFPEQPVEETMAALDKYGVESHESERSRVQLAILKLCDEDPGVELKAYVGMAKKDYRDVLSWAEYPQQSMGIARAGESAERTRELVRQDRLQYETWLAGRLRSGERA